MKETTRCSSGCAGLDDVLGGGLPSGHFYLIEGEPGTGKTTLALQFIELQDIELPTDAPDGAVWQRSQDVGALLITGNRSSGEGSLDQTIAEQAGPESLPVLTIGDPRRVIRDPAYARECAISLLDFVERIETLRGTGRLFIP